MIFDLLQQLMSGQFSTISLALALLTIPVVLISLCFHELSHGYIAYKLGDPTAKMYGRLTMNPLSHLDPFGTLSMMLFGIGWAKPVPINARNFRNPKKGMAITGLAGPVSNLILAFGSFLAYRIIDSFASLSFMLKGGDIYYIAGVKYSLLDYVGLFLIVSTMLNISLAVFNLIPIPPFDGSRIFYFVLPDRFYFGIMRYERIIMLVTMAVLFSGVADPLLSGARNCIMIIFDLVVGLVPFL